MHRSRGLGHGVVVSKSCYNTVIVLSVVLSDCCKPMNSCQEWAFSISGLEVWLQAFQLPMIAKCEAVPNEICRSCLFQEFIPVIPLGMSKQPLPTRRRFLRAAARSTSCTSSALLHHAHPFVAAAEKNLSHAQKQRGWSWSCAMSLLQTINNYRDWAFSSSGLEAGLPAFLLPLFTKCDALPEGDLFDMLV